jgi:hypothetical protein
MTEERVKIREFNITHLHSNRIRMMWVLCRTFQKE